MLRKLSGLILFVCSLALGMVHAEPAVLRVVFGDASPPVYWNTGGGTEGGQGLLIELMGEVARVSGFEFAGQTFPLPRVQSLVMSGERDAMVNVATPARLVYALASSEPLLTGPVRIFVHRDSPLVDQLRTVKTLDDLKSIPLTVGGLLGSSWTKTNIEDRGIKVDYSSGTGSAVRKLIAKRVDAVIDLSLNIHWILKDEPEGKDILELPVTIENVGWYLLVSKKSSFSDEMDRLNSAIRLVKQSARYQEILRKYTPR